METRVRSDRHGGQVLSAKAAKLTTAAGLVGVLVTGGPSAVGATTNTVISTQNNCTFYGQHSYTSPPPVAGSTLISVDEHDCQNFTRVRFDFYNGTTESVSSNSKYVSWSSSYGGSGFKQTVHFARDSGGTLLGQGNPA